MRRRRRCNAADSFSLFMNFSLCTRNNGDGGSNSNGTQDNHFGLMIRTFANGYYRHPATFCENDLPHAQTPYQVLTCVVAAAVVVVVVCGLLLSLNSGQRRLTWGSHCHPRYLRVWLAGWLAGDDTDTHREWLTVCAQGHFDIPSLRLSSQFNLVLFSSFFVCGVIHSFIQPW